MGKAPLEIQREGEITVLRFTATSLLDPSTLQHLDDEFQRVVKEMGRCRLVVDFSGVKFMSSSALGVLIKLDQVIKAARGRLALACLDQGLKGSFKISGLDKVFDFYDTQDKAVQSFGPSGL